MSVTYDFGTIFLLDSPEALSSFRSRLFCVKDIFSNIGLNYEIGMILIYRSINFVKVQY